MVRRCVPALLCVVLIGAGWWTFLAHNRSADAVSVPVSLGQVPVGDIRNWPLSFAASQTNFPLPVPGSYALPPLGMAPGRPFAHSQGG